MKNSINGFLLTPLLFLGMQMAVASPSYLVPPPLSPTTATNCFSDGTKTIRSQATAVLPNGLPLVGCSCDRRARSDQRYRPGTFYVESCSPRLPDMAQATVQDPPATPLPSPASIRAGSP